MPSPILQSVDPAIEYIGLLYGRASVDRRKKGRSVNAQLRDVRYDFDEHGWPVARVFRDDDRSASRYATKKRDDFERMVDCVRAREGLAEHQRHIVGAWEASRLSRDLEVFFSLRRAAMDTGALIYVDGEIFDMRVSKQRHRLTEMVMDAEKEADAIQARNARTARLSVADGGIHGRIPYAYRREYDPDTGDLLRQVLDTGAPGGPDPTENVRFIVRAIAAQVGINRIQSDFFERGIPNPTGGERWDRASIRDIAMNPVYLGLRTHRGEVVGKGSWPALLTGPDEEAFHRAQAVLRSPERVTHRGVEPVHLCSHIATCGKSLDDGDEVCGGWMERKGKSDRPGYSYYSCSTCHRVSIALPALDDYVTALLLAWLEAPGRAEQILAASSPDASSDALAEVAKLEAELSEARRLASHRQLSPAGLAAAEMGILPALTAARQKVRSFVPIPELLELAAPDARARWAAMDDVRLRRAVIRSLMRIQVTSTGVKGLRAPKHLPQRVKVDWILGQAVGEA